MEHQQRNRRPSRHAPLGVAHRQHSRERASWRCRSRGGRTGGRVKDALFGQICTSRSHFPRSRFLKVQICPNQCTHPAHAPHAPRPHPVLRCPTVQKTGRFTSPSPISAGHSPSKTQICRFFVLSSKNHTRMTLKKACPETTLEPGQAFCCEKLSY